MAETYFSRSTAVWFVWVLYNKWIDKKNRIFIAFYGQFRSDPGGLDFALHRAMGWYATQVDYVSNVRWIIVKEYGWIWSVSTVVPRWCCCLWKMWRYAVPINWPLNPSPANVSCRTWKHIFVCKSPTICDQGLTKPEIYFVWCASGLEETLLILVYIAVSAVVTWMAWISCCGDRWVGDIFLIMDHSVCIPNS